MDVLRGKLTVPRTRGRLVRRPRIVQLLDRIRDVRLTVLSAPAGYGKTCALVDWLDAAGVANVWVWLDRGDDDPARFLRLLATALTPVPGDPAAADPAAAPTGVGLSGAAAADPREIAREILDLLDGAPRPLVIVLDDVHVVTAAVVVQVVQTLIDHLPAGVHLVLAGREDPPLRLSRLRLDGELLQVRADDLRFTVVEAARFLASRMGLALLPEDVGALVARAEGWPAALQLAGVWLAGVPDPSRQVHEFAADHRLVLDYVTEEVLAGLDPATMDFLLGTCVLDRLTGDLCDAVTGRADGAATLEQLERANLFVVRLDEPGSWFRYHRLFADLLRTRVGAARPVAVRAAHLRAARWHLDAGLAREALEHAVAGGDPASAADVVWRASAALLHAGDLAGVRAALDRLPEDVARSSLLVATLQAWTRALAGEPDDVETWLADAEAAGERAEPGTEPLAVPLPGLAAMIRSAAARSQGRADDAVALAERALALEPAGLPPPLADLFRGDGLTVLGHARLLAGQVDGAIEAYRAAIPLVRRTGNRLAVAETTRNLARLEARRGRPEDGLAACLSALPAGRLETPSDALVLLARAELELRLGRPGALDVARRAHALAVRGGDLVTLREARGLLDAAAPAVPREPAVAAWADGGLGAQPLTPREVEVLALVAAGRSNRQIAEHLFVTVGTVKSHVHAVAVKLGAANRTEAVARGRALGLLR